MTVLVIGKDGQVGRELASVFGKRARVVALGRAELDLVDLHNAAVAVRRLSPRVIINAAAYTAVDQAESQRDLAMQINANAPEVLANEAKQLGALLVHYSTDYVFDGEKNEPYVESDAPNPVNVYGETKLAGERAIAAAGCEYMILRTSWVYAARGRNFLLTMLKLARERATLRVVDDQIGSPTWARDIAEATVRLLDLPSAVRIERVYHLCAQGFTTWHGFASTIFQSAAVERQGIPVPRLEPITSSEYPAIARRPRNSRLNCERLAGLGIRLPDWQGSLQRCLDEMDQPDG